MNTFAVTAMGRSGTKFLSQTLSKAEGWTVKHEPHPGFQPTSEVKLRFSGVINYGEVNSYLRFQLMSLEVDRKAVIIRHPIQIFQSMYNRGKPKLDHLEESLYALDNLISQGVSVISFSRMVDDQNYLRSVAKYLGVELPVRLDLKPINTSSQKAMPQELLSAAIKKLSWFTKLYGDLL